ncbi:hypothetical protein CLV30_101441 [Haloactinopolyspora alba]|uniref:Uncharacterized protein n=1 Tax=Haloactinopolyspora alba TaxID=648780 RepID=A0A2P8EG79_9ACTN|nr:hypothetical protein CLV30_101441 [Haloactinopolyspora alba]
MHRCNRHGDGDVPECWTLRALRRLREHTAVMTVIYEDVRPLGKGLAKGAVVTSGCFAGLDVLEQVVALLA